jgi:hypothetical protein
MLVAAEPPPPKALVNTEDAAASAEVAFAPALAPGLEVDFFPPAPRLAVTVLRDSGEVSVFTASIGHAAKGRKLASGGACLKGADPASPKL